VSAWGDAFAAEQARLRVARPVPKREPLLAAAGRLAARAVAGLPRLRTAAMSVGGFGCLVAAAWMVAVPAGLAAAGCSLLLLEYLSGEQGGSRR
jgi:hypothetical protein